MKRWRIRDEGGGRLRSEELTSMRMVAKGKAKLHYAGYGDILPVQAWPVDRADDGNESAS